MVERKGVVMFECPFCFPSHPLVVEEEAKCGTTLNLVATQRTYQSMKCAKCGKFDGTLIKRGDDYIHAHDCVPGVMLLDEDPVPSMSARMVYYLPERLRRWISGRRQQVPARLNHEGEIVFTWMNV
jgi:predicted RNA-binding Zn-ribbon protein involved in translation (DUF1610 family)